MLTYLANSVAARMATHLVVNPLARKALLRLPISMLHAVSSNSDNASQSHGRAKPNRQRLRRWHSWLSTP